MSTPELQSGDVVRERPLGVAEIATLLGVQPGTVHAWKKRGLLPTPDLTVGGIPAYWQSTIESWARATGRLDSGEKMSVAIDEEE